MSDRCTSPGCCTCPNEPRCPLCGYTKHDAQFLMDHNLCNGEIPERKTAAKTRRAPLTVADAMEVPEVWELVEFMRHRPWVNLEADRVDGLLAPFLAAMKEKR